MQNKLFAIMITALLVLCMAGSAMCVTYDSSVTLVEKDSGWQQVEDGASVTVEFNEAGEEFEWRVTGNTPYAGEYCLIYYADKPDRFVNWGGNNPGALICTVRANNNRIIMNNNDWKNSGSIELDMNLPCCPDANMNISEHDYCDAPDYHDHCTGAKLWLVPSSDYTEPAMTDWNPADYLFETDLIWYDDTGVNEIPEIVETGNDAGDGYTAGDEEGVTISAIVCDNDGVGDLVSVTADFSQHGIEGLATMELVEVLNCTCAYYESEPVVINQSTCDCDDCEQVDVEIVATDSTEESDEATTNFYVYPGECFLVIDGPEKAFTQSIIYLDVYCENEFGIRRSCCTDFASNIIGDASHAAEWDEEDCTGEIQVVDYGIPGEVMVKACCLCDDERKSVTHNITYMNQIGGLNLTADPEFLYEISTCGDDLDCTDISAQLTDESGDPVPMPGITITFTVEGYVEVNETNNDGIATFRLCMDPSYGESISVDVTTRCITEPIVIYVVENVLATVVIDDPESPVTCDYVQDLNYTCYTNHSTQMCCPTYEVCEPSNVAWNCINGLGSFDPIDERSTYFTALDSGTAVVEVNVSGIIDTEEIVINCMPNCAEIPDGCICSPHPFEVASGSVTLSGNFTETGCEITGWACVEAIGDPIDWTNDTRGAIVNVSEDRTEDVMLNLSGEGDTWKYNETTGNWSKYANGSVSEVSNGTYALVTPGVDPDPCEGVTCEAMTCVGVDRYNMTCEYGICVAYMLIEANCAECGYAEPTLTPTYRRSSGGSGSGGTYPPGWGDPVNTTTPEPEAEPEAEPTDKPDDKLTPLPEPTKKLPGGDKVNATEDDAPGGADPTNAILVVLGILALLVIGYVLYRKSQNGE